MIKVNEKDVSSMLVDIKLKLARTYKGDIERTQTGKVSAFPTSFITPGFDLQFLGPRDDIESLEQMMLASDVFLLQLVHGKVSIRGAFSCTSNEKTEVRDKGERSLRLSVSVVSDGSNITDADGQPFSISTSQGQVLMSNCYFGKVYTVFGAYELNGFKLVNGKVLVLSQTVLEEY